MKTSRNNILIPLDKDSEWRYVLYNALSGHVTFLNEDYNAALARLENSTDYEPDLAIREDLHSRGFIFHDEVEEAKLEQTYLNAAIDSIKTRTPNLYAIVTGFDCPGSCPACAHMSGSRPRMDIQTLDRVLAAIQELEAEAPNKIKPVLLLIGGETLPDDEAGSSFIDHLLDNYGDTFRLLIFSTMGFNTERYSRFQTSGISSKVVFLFNVAALDQGERLLPQATMESVETIRRTGALVRLNLKITPQTVHLVPKVVNELIGTGFAFSNNCSFRLMPMSEANCVVYQPCAINYDVLNDVFGLYREYPQMEFAGLAGRGVADRLQTLLKRRERLGHRIHYCEANSSLYIFGSEGAIFTCYHAVQHPEMAVGSVDRRPLVDSALREPWLRTVLEIAGCESCQAKFLCSGGCAYQSLLETGITLSPACQPYARTMKSAFEALYMDFLDSERYSPANETT